MIKRHPPTTTQPKTLAIHALQDAKSRLRLAIQDLSILFLPPRRSHRTTLYALEEVVARQSRPALARQTTSLSRCPSFDPRTGTCIKFHRVRIPSCFSGRSAASGRCPAQGTLAIQAAETTARPSVSLSPAPKIFLPPRRSHQTTFCALEEVVARQSLPALARQMTTSSRWLGPAPSSNAHAYYFVPGYTGVDDEADPCASNVNSGFISASVASIITCRAAASSLTAYGYHFALQGDYFPGYSALSTAHGGDRPN
ncbi:hypothetical protein B0H11DRAFT_2209586 [Mycena galericulata]|nr:hypothetical protein B0H11DRAFT_2209586 [Mycena galericulata]